MGGIVVRPGDFNPERVILDDAIVVPSPAVNTGDTFTGPAVGVLDYGFGNYKLCRDHPHGPGRPGPRPRSHPTRWARRGLGRRRSTSRTSSPNDPPTKFAELADLVVDHLRSPDIIGLEEIQDDNGPTNDGITSAGVTLDTLVAAIAAAGGPDLPVPPDRSRSTARTAANRAATSGSASCSAPIAASRSSTVRVALDRRRSPWSTVPSGPQLSASPGRVDPANPAWTTSRKPLAAEFTVAGETFFVIVNHFNSKGGDQPLFGRTQPPVLSSEVQRRQQATVLHDFIDVDPGQGFRGQRDRAG